MNQKSHEDILMKVKALLLAAGFGTRLRPATDSIPKCLVKIGGEPILERWLKQLISLGCKDILVNTHYKADAVNRFIHQRIYKNFVSTTYEHELLGTAGTLLEHKNFFIGNIGLLIHTDNYTDFDLSLLINAFINKPKNCILTMLTFNTESPESCGIVECDENGIVQMFHEKSKLSTGTTANGAIYVFDDKLFEFLDTLEHSISDFSTEVLPYLVGRINTYHTSEVYLDIGTPETLKEARKICKSLQSK